MDIRKIALYLAGKLPPYYGSSNLYAFSKKLKDFAKEEFTKEEMLFVQQQAKNIDEEVYFMVLDDLWKSATDVPEEGKKSKDDIVALLRGLGVVDEVFGIEIKDKVIKTKTIGWITPFDDTGFIRKDILNEISGPLGYGVQEVKMDRDSSGNFLWDSIKGFLNKYDIYVVDIREKNLNVAIELGYILAQEKEIIVVTDQELPSDIRGFKYIKPRTVSVTAGTGGISQVEIEEMEKELKSDLGKAIKAKIEYLKSL